MTHYPIGVYCISSNLNNLGCKGLKEATIIKAKIRVYPRCTQAVLPSSGSQKLADIGVALKEWVGLVAYYPMGRTDELFPAPQPQ